MSTVMSPSTQQNHSPGLATLVKDLARDLVGEGGNILDLGPPASGAARAFLNLKCKCHVEDLVEYLEQVSRDDPAANQKLNDHLLPKPEGLKFDLVLGWDIFSFLAFDTIASLMARLSPHFKQGTVLYILAYTDTTAPIKPKRFKMLEDFSCRTAGDAYRVNAIKPHSGAELLEYMQEFSLRGKLIESETMADNITEVLLTFDPSLSQ
ncbi:hypothetical protein FKG94_23980 [Exilibacterium tricleocarpae]|uniref:Class I SAM-dependent methyltransferase n=1 Tax=Exilibacterium tricleocarpae TaxID=2591008 RepID=A0A545ST58_9GAMM|nr:hypothetical protein [Exilibacterium tricleocarpae]TQV68153.1 hypothetical protein FKG94_23980 [Exilibacterium tricleocarpae]